jgi:hypothetical protein
MAVTAAGLVTIAGSWWFPYRAVLIAGAAVTVFGAVMLGVVFSRGRAWHEQDVLIGRLWALAKRLPSGWAFTDPLTGEFLSAQRERGWLTLAVSDTPGMGGTDGGGQLSGGQMGHAGAAAAVPAPGQRSGRAAGQLAEAAARAGR